MHYLQCPTRSAWPDGVASLHLQFYCGHSVSVKLHNWYYLTSRQYNKAWLCRATQFGKIVIITLATVLCFRNVHKLPRRKYTTALPLSFAPRRRHHRRRRRAPPNTGLLQLVSYAQLMDKKCMQLQQNEVGLASYIAALLCQCMQLMLCSAVQPSPCYSVSFPSNFAFVVVLPSFFPHENSLSQFLLTATAYSSPTIVCYV